MIIMKDAIIPKKAMEKKKLLEGIADITVLTEVAQKSSSINFAKKYKYIMSNTDIDIAKKLKLTRAKKY